MFKDTRKSSVDSTANPGDERNRRRSERVVLRVPLRLSAIMPDGKRISIEAHSLVVNAHGGLLDVGMEMVSGQQIRLSNPSTEVITTGRVVRVEGAEAGRFSVAFEFESPAPHFWPVSFPPADWSYVESRA
jgi:PilZ domain